MTALEIGEYAGCTHGPYGSRLYGCIPCALKWHTERQVYHAEKAEYHLAMLRRLEDEQITRALDRAEASSALAHDDHGQQDAGQEQPGEVLEDPKKKAAQ